MTLWRALQEVGEGFYVDVGARDPVVDSVTLAFYERNWRGINIEASLESCAKLARHRERDLTLHAFACDKAGFVPFWDFGALGISTGSAALAAQHQRAGFVARECVVPAVTLNDVLSFAAAAPIHFLKIDVEGAEGAVLRGLDLRRFRPWIVVVEALAPLSTTPTEKEFEPLLLSADYVFCYFDGLNRFYVSRERHDHLAPLLAAPSSEMAGFTRATDDHRKTASRPDGDAGSGSRGQAEAVPAAPLSPFYHYHSCFDAQQLIRQYAAPDLVPTPGYLTNFLGVKMDPKFAPSILAGREGQLEAIPIPTSWHADIAEWGAALRAVDLAAGPEFVLVELGCGWGCWMNNGGKAAQKRNLRVHLIGVEGDESYCRLAAESLLCNGFKEEEFEVRRGVAGAIPGTALFPRQSERAHSWGLEPIFGASPEQIAEALATNSCDVLPILPLADVFAQHARIDLLHVDIQGGELDLVSQSLPVLSEKVAYLLIGTHSREIEGSLIALLRRHGWQLEIERPAILKVDTVRQPGILADGVQGWRNQGRISAPVLASGVSVTVAKDDFAFAFSFLVSGWSVLEPELVWSEGKVAELALEFASSGSKSLYLDLFPFLPTTQSTQRIEVSANEVPLGGVTFRSPAERAKHYFDLPNGLGKSVALKIAIENPVSPLEAHVSIDSRPLGVALYGFGVIERRVTPPGRLLMPKESGS